MGVLVFPAVSSQSLALLRRLLQKDVQHVPWSMVAARLLRSQHPAVTPTNNVPIKLIKMPIFGHIARMDDDADAKMILSAPPPYNWKRPPGRPRIMWLNIVQHDLRAYNLTLNEAVDLAQNCPLWRLMSTYMAVCTLSGACQKRRRLILTGCLKRSVNCCHHYRCKITSLTSQWGH